MENVVVRDGVVVALDYSLIVDGNLIDSSGDTPLEYLQGYNNIIPGLERRLAGMTVEQEKEIVVMPDDAYGQYDPEGVFQLAKSQFPPSFPLEIGYPFRVRTDEGRVLNARVISLNDDRVEVDTNHPLAGKQLYFQVKICSLREPTAEELLYGRVGGNCSTCGSSAGCEGSCS